MTQKMTILGSTGSIGTQALSVATHLGIKVDAISVGRNISLAEEQIRFFKPDICAVNDTTAARELKIAVADTGVRIIDGKDAATTLTEISDSDTVLDAISGFAGLFPALVAAKRGKKLAIANKESLVAAGFLVKKELAKSAGVMIPVDSEHCAIHQCIDGKDPSEISRLIITASGGAFFGRTKAELENATLAEACTHPNWSMGRKITIDSASLVNKGLELMEAVRLFDIPEDRIDTIVHRESIVHSMAEFCDGSVLAQMAVPDMRLCIQYAMTYPEKLPGQTPHLDLAKVARLTFYDVDSTAFPAIDLARRAIRTGGVHPCVYNAANEAAVELFCEQKIKFTDIYRAIEYALDCIPVVADSSLTLDTIVEADRASRNKVAEMF